MLAYYIMLEELSVFFPCFNEEKNVGNTVKKAKKVLENLNLRKWEILIVDDGSKDNTPKIADRLASEDSRIKAIHQENGGYGAALQSGFYKSKYEWVTYTDSDGQFDFAEVDKFIEETKNADLIMGFRIKRRDPYIRLVLAKGWSFLLLVFFGLKLKDVDCGFKMVNRKVLDSIAPLKSSRGAMINVELVIKANKNNFKISQVGVNHYPRIYGKPTGASMRVIVRSFIDLIKLRLNLL